MNRLPRQLESLARMLTYMLGHRPDEFGLVLGEDGSIPVKQLLQALASEPGWGFVRRHHLEQLAGLMQPPAFELAGEHLRALTPGPDRLRRPGASPPALLYAAIPARVQARVWEEGLKPPSGQELVLAATRETALKLGRRLGPELILVTVQAQAAARAGTKFVGYGDELFLAPALPRDFIQMPPPPQQQEKARPEKAPRLQPSPGSVILDLPQLFQPKPPKIRGKDKKGEPAWKAGTRGLRRQRRREDGAKGEKGNIIAGAKGDKGKRPKG
jgi:putative RNA 2'-phosphotransferase